LPEVDNRRRGFHWLPEAQQRHALHERRGGIGGEGAIPRLVSEASRVDGCSLQDLTAAYGPPSGHEVSIQEAGNTVLRERPSMNLVDGAGPSTAPVAHLSRLCARTILMTRHHDRDAGRPVSGARPKGGVVWQISIDCWG